jgi:hypothetical protein
MNLIGVACYGSDEKRKKLKNSGKYTLDKVEDCEFLSACKVPI